MNTQLLTPLGKAHPGTTRAASGRASAGPQRARIDVFVAYASEQRELADRIVGILHKAGLKTFLDRKDLHFSEGYDAAILDAIAEASVLVFLVSPRAVTTGSYALHELETAFGSWSKTSAATRRILTIRTDFVTEVPALVRDAPCLLATEVTTHLVPMMRRGRRHDPRVRRMRIARWTAALGTIASVMALGSAALLLPSMLPAPRSAPPADDGSSVRASHALANSASLAPPLEEQVEAPAQIIEPPGPAESVSRNSVELELAPGTSLTFMRLPAGSFTMGSPPGSAQGPIPEPQQRFVMPEQWMTSTEITQAAWTAVMGSPAPFSAKCEPHCGDDYPATHVTYDEALAFANALSEALGRPPCYERRDGQWFEPSSCEGVRLPTEVEWEYAARAGTTTSYSFGDDPSLLCVYANGRDQARAVRSKASPSLLSCNDGFASLAPVAKLQPNPWGLFDMHGNVWEWVSGPAPGGRSRRLLRGGSFVDGSGGLRSAKRYEQPKGMRYRSVGLRGIVTEGTLPLVGEREDTP